MTMSVASMHNSEDYERFRGFFYLNERSVLQINVMQTSLREKSQTCGMLTGHGIDRLCFRELQAP